MDLLRLILQNTKDIKRIKKQLICCTGGGTSCPTLSADLGNILECREDGLYATASGGGGMEIGGLVVDGTPGSVLFIGAGGTLAEDNPNFFYNDTSNALAIGKNTSLNAKFSIHDVVNTNYLSLSTPDTEDPSDPGNPYTIQYYLKQVDGEWGEGFPTPGTGLRLEFIGTYAGTDPTPGLFQFGMPVWIDGDPDNFVYSVKVNGYNGISVNVDDIGIDITSPQTGMRINTTSLGIQFSNVNTGLASNFGEVNTLFGISCVSGGSIEADSGSTTISSNTNIGLTAANSSTTLPALLASRISTTGSTVDPIFTMRATTNFVVLANSGLYFNLQPALPASQVSDALRVAARWTSVASPTSEIQIFGRNANVDTQLMTIQSTANGRVGIGSTVTSPTARLHLPAGTTTANTAPLKFTAGTNLTTGEAGTMEYNGTSLFFTPTGTTRLRHVLTDNTIPSNGQIPIGNGTNYTNATLTGGVGINVTNGAGTITLDADATEVLVKADYKGGQSAFVADGTTTVFNITHNLGFTPSYFTLTTTAPIASNHLNRTITFPDVNTMRITFNVAPSVGEDANYVWIVFK